MTDKKNFIFESPIKNDKVDIYGEPEVFTKVIDTKNNKEMQIIIEGSAIDNSIANAIRRAVMMYIPVYGFHRSNIHIEIDKTSYMYNNDLVYNQIETLPIFDIPNYFDLENPEIFLSNEVMKNLFGKFVQDKFMPEETENEDQTVDANKRLFKIELSINVKNNTGSDKFVNTHDCVLKVDGKIADSYKKRDPICILVLKPTESISLSAEANLGISRIFASYEATTNAIHIEHSSSSYEIQYETLEQLDKNMIFTKACIILIKKLEYLNKFIKKKFKEERDVNELIEIELYGEDHTLGYLLATALQKCAYVEAAGYVMPHAFSDQIRIDYKLITKSKVGPIKVFSDTIDYLVKVFQKIINVAFKKSK